MDHRWCPVVFQWTREMDSRGIQPHGGPLWVVPVISHPAPPHLDLATACVFADSTCTIRVETHLSVVFRLNSHSASVPAFAVIVFEHVSSSSSSIDKAEDVSRYFAWSSRKMCRRILGADESDCGDTCRVRFTYSGAPAPPLPTVDAAHRRTANNPGLGC